MAAAGEAAARRTRLSNTYALLTRQRFLAALLLLPLPLWMVVLARHSQPEATSTWQTRVVAVRPWQSLSSAAPVAGRLLLLLNVLLYSYLPV
jgi:hypothetical protein